MRILYLTQRFDINNRGIQTDLLCSLSEAGHDVTIVTCELKEKIHDEHSKNTKYFNMVFVPVDNQFSVNPIKKGLVQLTIPYKMKKTIKRRLGSSEFDLILYATPPVTFANVVKFCKKKFNCKTFLALKDIFPQNAVDLGMISKRSLVYWMFRMTEKKLLNVSDYIGCMSEANIKYVTKHNPEINKEKLVLFPNTIKPYEVNKNFSREEFLNKLGVPNNKTIFLFGGNLGKPQALDLLLDAIDHLKDYSKAYFVVLGKGSEYARIEECFIKNKYPNAKLVSFLPSEEYNQSILACDVGLILLKPEITVPNIPEKTLSYMANGRPILAATDSTTDVGEIIEVMAGCGKWSLSNNLDEFIENIIYLCENPEERKKMGDNGREYFNNNWNVSTSVQIINSLFEKTNVES